jgi:hypothetical protein
VTAAPVIGGAGGCAGFCAQTGAARTLQLNNKIEPRIIL